MQAKKVPPNTFWSLSTYSRSIELTFAENRKAALKAFAHAGEEAPPPKYISESLDLLKVHRSDYGIRCLEDETLTKKVAETKMALITSPLSNLELKVVKDLRDLPLRKMRDADLRVMIHSDDPSYSGRYMNENYLAITEALDVTKEDLTKLAINGFQASCMEEGRRTSGSTRFKSIINSAGTR